MKIGIFADTFWPDINGVASSSYILRNELRKHGHDVLIVTTELPDGVTSDDDASIIRLPGIEFKKLYGYRISSIYSSKGMREIKSLGLDLIHIQTEFGIGIFGKIAGEILNLPVVYTYHTLYEDYTHYISTGVIIEPIVKKLVTTFSRIYGDNCTELIVPSKKTKEVLNQYGIEKEMHVVPTGLELDSFNPQNKDLQKMKEIEEELGLRDEYRVVTVGRIAKEKSIDILIESFKVIKEKNINAKLIIVGGGPSLEELKEYTKQLELDDYVIFTGPKASKLVPSYYHISDIFTSASISETQGLTFIEAMASGIPVLCREDKNLEGIVVEDRNGYYFEDAKQLGELIIACMNKDTSELSKNALIDASEFSSEQFYESIIEIYEQAIKNKLYLYHITNVYPLSNNYYEVVFKSDNNEVTLELSEKVIMKYDLEKNKTIDRAVLDDLKDHELIAQAYKKALRFLTIRDYTYKQMRDKLLKDDSFDEFHIDMTLEALVEKNLVNDKEYAENYFSRASKMGTGINKVIRNLRDKGISNEIIEDYLDTFSDENEVENAKELIEKVYSNNSNKPRLALLNTIKNRLYSRGFSLDVIHQALDESEVQVDADFENMLLEKEAKKALTKYSRKYSGDVLVQKIVVYLNRKGFETSDIIKWRDSHLEELMNAERN